MILDILSTPGALMNGAVDSTTTGSGRITVGGFPNTLQNCSPGGSARTLFPPAEKLILFGIDILLPVGVKWNLGSGWGNALPNYTFLYRQGTTNYQIPELGFIPFNGVARGNIPAYGIALDPRAVIGSGFDITLPYSLYVDIDTSSAEYWILDPTITDLLDPTVGVDIYTDWFLGAGFPLDAIPQVFVGHTNPMVP